MKVEKTSLFVSPSDVKDGDLLSFTNEGEEAEGKFGIKLVIGVCLAGGVNKKLTLNNTSKNNMIKEYGDDTAKWVGKEARINVIKALISGDTKKVIILTYPSKDAEGNVINQ